MSMTPSSLLIWNLEYSKCCFQFNSLEGDDSTEFCASRFHPTLDYLLLASTIKGEVGVYDLREMSRGRHPTTTYHTHGSGTLNLETFYSSVDSRFCSDQRYIISRDCFNIKVWDRTMNERPLKNFPICEMLNPQIQFATNRNLILDHFLLDNTPQGDFLVTGSYDGAFHIVDPQKDTNFRYCLNFTKDTIKHDMKSNESTQIADNVNFDKKTLNIACNPANNSIVVASNSNLHLYNFKKLKNE